jgi:hypothetical protein
MPAAPEFDEETLIGLGKLAIALSRNKDTGRPFRALVKKVDPQRQFPSDEVQDLREQIEADKETRKLEDEQKKVLAEQAAEKTAIARIYTDEQIKEIEALMTKHGLSSYELGAKLYAADLKPAKQKGREQLTSNTWEFPKADGLFEDPAKFALKEAGKVIDEIQQGIFARQ